VEYRAARRVAVSVSIFSQDVIGAPKMIERSRSRLRAQAGKPYEVRFSSLPTAIASSS